MNSNILIYGSYGYTGKLTVAECLTKGLKPILSGRNEEKLKKQADETGLPYEVIDINDGDKLRQVIEKVDVVIHCGGPFVHTAKQMVEACIDSGAHYLDITGEYQVFEMLQAYDEKAKAKGLQIMPGAGFDVVPSDCMAAHLKSRMPDATSLELAFVMDGGGVSRGTAKTVVENLGEDAVVRQDGKLVEVPNAWHVKEIDFGTMQSKTATIAWGDVSSAYWSTKIPNIEVTMGVNDAMLKSLKSNNYMGWLLRLKFIKKFLMNRIDNRPAGPSDKRRAKSKSLFWGKVTNDKGDTMVSTMQSPEGYTLTALTSVVCAEKLLNGQVKPGYQTPSTAFGKDFILEIPKCTRQDLN